MKRENISVIIVALCVAMLGMSFVYMQYEYNELVYAHNDIINYLGNVTDTYNSIFERLAIHLEETEMEYNISFGNTSR